MKYILNKRLKFYTKKGIELLGIMSIGAFIMITFVLIKFKPSYIVTISGEKVGYINSRKSLEDEVKAAVIDTNDKQENIDSIVCSKEPEYEFGLVSRKEESNEDKIVEEIQENMDITYKYYEIALSDVAVDSVNTLDDAESLVKEVKEEKKEDSEKVDLSIIEKYTEDPEKIKTNAVEEAKENITSAVTEKLVAEQKAKEEQERINAMPVVNGIKLAYTPVKGVISSRFGVNSSIRKSSHTGLDIACPSGTPIKVVQDGTITNASYSGSYGNLVKVSHGNGIETWYAHTSKMYVNVGQKVKAGDIIAAVGSTGNSTGAHLHLEIRIDGTAVNPQKYLYK